MALLKEFCAENVEHVPAAVAAGAGRIELCDNLAVGGTSPSYGVIRAAVDFASAHDVDVMAMARPRGGNFVYTPEEEQMMLDDVAMARSPGRLGRGVRLPGCRPRNRRAGNRPRHDQAPRRGRAWSVLGADGTEQDIPPVWVTFHMAFDELSEPRQLEAIDYLAELGVERILTHGGAAGTPSWTTSIA